MTKVYVCPHCGARGFDILRMRVTSDDVHIWYDLKEGIMKSYVDDWYETIERYCTICDEELDESADEYIVDE